MIIALSITLGVVILLLISAILHIQKIQQELITIDREQHTQNMDIIDLLKYRMDSTEAILQQAEVLKYLIEQDPRLSSKKVVYPNIIGEA
jgi:hypothetical protein